MNKVVDTYYRENYDALVKRLSYRLGTRENAEDAVQEAFARAIKYFESCNIDFDRWFKVLLANVVKAAQNDLRMAGLAKSIDDSLEELEPIVPDHVKDLFRNHMDRLANGKASFTKEIIRLHILFGYNSKEIAGLVGLTNGSVRNVLTDFTKEVQEIYG
jgi:RNA polymerase sigma factor (sigma-70 family)